ncbi:hypothetical protein FHG87_002833 [Trinorchestia longiramus]|nr:hypothetical protein FHG87_002833 [Trinorchestia longiramus]
MKQNWFKWLCLAVAAGTMTLRHEAFAQLSKKGACPNYQTDRKFQLKLIEKVAGHTYYIIHRLPNEREANHTCSNIVFNADNSFKYYYVDANGILTYYNGQWTAEPTTLTSPGRISLRFEFIDIMGSDVTGLTELLILWSTGSLLFTTIHCKPGAIGYYEEYMYTLARGELLYLPKFADILESTLINTGTVNSQQLQAVPQTCNKKFPFKKKDD